MEIMNYKEAAAFLKITEGTLRNWVSQGRIKPHKVGKHVLFSRGDLELWILNPTLAANARPATAKPAPQAKRQPVEPSISSEWDACFEVSFSGKADAEPFALIESLPDKFVKMTPGSLRELARYLVIPAEMCEDPSFRGVKQHRISREPSRDLTSVCLIPEDIARDLKNLSQIATRVYDPGATTPERYIIRFICDGLRNKLPMINKLLTEKGKRAIRFISVY
jgi:excisionase family DNA binding protein